MPTISIFDPTTKLLIQLAQSTLDRMLETIASKHKDDRKAVDAIDAARQAIDGAVQALVNLTPENVHQPSPGSAPQ